MIRSVLIFVACIGLMSCATPNEDLTKAPKPLGEFRLGHNIAIADNVTLGPFSRQLSETKLEASVQNAVAKRLRRYDGDGLYHLGIVVGGLVLAQPGIPVVYAPQSVMIVDVTVFDNSTQEKLNAKPKRITSGEGLRNAVPFLGSGYVRSADEQLANLSESVALGIERWLKDNPEWFEPKPGQIRVPYNVRTQAPSIDSSSTADIAEAAN